MKKRVQPRERVCRSGRRNEAISPADGREKREDGKGRQEKPPSEVPQNLVGRRAGDSAFLLKNLQESARQVRDVMVSGDGPVQTPESDVRQNVRDEEVSHVKMLVSVIAALREVNLRAVTANLWN